VTPKSSTGPTKKHRFPASASRRPDRLPYSWLPINKGGNSNHASYFFPLQANKRPRLHQGPRHEMLHGYATVSLFSKNPKKDFFSPKDKTPKVVSVQTRYSSGYEFPIRFSTGHGCY
jgi:hypothetical protein